MNKKVIYLDLKGLKCPLPILKTAKKLKEINKNDFLRVEADDDSYNNDINKLCEENNYKIVKKKKQNKCIYILIKKG